MFVFGVVSIEIWPTQMPVWALVVALFLGQSISREGMPFINIISSMHLHRPRRHNSGDNQSTNCNQRHCGAYRWLRSTWPSSRVDGFQDICIHRKHDIDISQLGVGSNAFARV